MVLTKSTILQEVLTANKIKGIIMLKNTAYTLFLPLIFLLSACGSGGDSVAPPETTYYNISGDVSGLIDSNLTIALNNKESLTLIKDGNFKFTTELENTLPYDVTIVTQPAAQSCEINNASGKIDAADINNIIITCNSTVLPKYGISGSLSGLTSSSLSLMLNEKESLILTKDGNFKFTTELENTLPYDVTIVTQPEGHHCEINNASGKIDAVDISNITLSCFALTYKVSGQLTGLDTATDLKIAMNDNEVLTLTADGTFTFSKLSHGTDYSVIVERGPARQECLINNDSGKALADVTNISVNCTADESAELFDITRLHKIKLTMTATEWQSFYNDTNRANYKNRDAMGTENIWNLWTHSEVYRSVNFKYINRDGSSVKFDNVGFKMRGNTSRQWPISGNSPNTKPKRFHFSLKFDEKFDEDESVYDAIFSGGLFERSQNVPEHLENDDRKFMGIDKLNFKFNKDDPTYAREMLAHDILNRVGVPTSRMVYASVELTITGDASEVDGYIISGSLPQTHNMGVFLLEEAIDKNFLKRYFKDNEIMFKVGSGDLASSEDTNTDCIAYESATTNNDPTSFINPDFCKIGIEKSDPENREEWLGTANYNDPTFDELNINKDNGVNDTQFAPYRPTYDLKTKKKSIVDARSDLQKFMTFVQSSPTAEQLATQFDVDGFIQAQAADIAMGAVDHYTRVANNYYLYYFPETEKWVYLTYDYDFVFNDFHHDSWGKNIPFENIVDSYAFSATGKTAWDESVINGVNPILWQIIFSEQSNKQKLYAHLESILDNELDWEKSVAPLLNSRDEMINSAINATTAGLPDGGCTAYNPLAIDAPEGDEKCYEEDMSIKVFIEKRQQALRAEISSARQ